MCLSLRPTAVLLHATVKGTETSLLEKERLIEERKRKKEKRRFGSEVVFKGTGDSPRKDFSLCW